ncbi:MAG TPA: thiamine phosphate synthase [Thermomicrobiales bacterium]|nr:thiamine phosphate synthase [Thermomicrobiales bacterium]
MPKPLVLVTEPDVSLGDLDRVVPEAVRGGVSHVLLRMPGASAADVYETGVHLRQMLDDLRTPLIVADRVDIALALGADVHLGQRGLPPGLTRALAPGRHVGVAVHDVDQGVEAAAHGADWVVFGHVFATPSHPGEPGRGLDALRAVVEAVEVPVVAIGGLTAANMADAVAAGAAGIAVMRAISGASDPEAAARSLREALDRPILLHSTPAREENP